ncbi:hypothetical protein CN341_19730 [Bacillus cereus]|uniref:hypothetical protein n=1 Tax=Bacillus cereus TaxID=1396 RepID=UPI000BF32EF0|nr:hypothetical protein [Bacillus cereus]PFF75828.1 hypothetical protein CN341_19730 [Bacillus cereus]
MIKIERENLEFLAQRHFREYFVGKKCFERLKKLKENEQNPMQQPFFESIFNQIEEIITGRPERLNGIAKDLNAKHPELMRKISRYNYWKRRLKFYRKELEKVKKKVKGKNKEHSSVVHSSKRKELKLEMIINKIHIYVQETGEFLGKINNIFDYGNFRDQYGIDKEGKRMWGAYELVKQLKVSVCPYCNRQFITVSEPSEDEGGRTRPQLDHFYSQSKFPFFSVSFFNLIPCCYVCNSNLKRDQEFSIDTHMHPYENSFEDLVQFTVKFKAEKDDEDYLKVWNSNTDLFSIDIKVNELKRVNYNEEEFYNLYKKIEKNRKTFKLKTLYNTHKDYVGEILVKSRTYNDDKINSLCKEFPDLFSTKEDLVRLVYSNYVDSSQFDKRVLAKLTRDITEEFGIKYI